MADENAHDQNFRQAAAQWFQEAQEAVVEADAQEYAPQQQAHLAIAQVRLQQAIYAETVYANNMTVQLAAAVERQNKTLENLAFQMEKIASHLGDR